jgi:phosphoenolpyruvate carboxykinase (ATP)
MESENTNFSFASGILPKIQTNGDGNTKKMTNGICHDDSVPPVKAQTIHELHSLQRKRSAPNTPVKDGASGGAVFATISEEERQMLQLQSIRYCTSLYLYLSLTLFFFLFFILILIR